MSFSRGISTLSSPFFANRTEPPVRSTCHPRYNNNMSAMFGSDATGTYLLGECNKFRLALEEQKRARILQRQTIIRSLFTASDFIPNRNFSSANALLTATNSTRNIPNCAHNLINEELVFLRRCFFSRIPHFTITSLH